MSRSSMYLTGGSRPARATDRVEWPTILVVAGFHTAFVTLVVVHAALPWPVVMIGFALLGGLYMSLLHEVLHGHPTPSQRFNEALVILPSLVWLPYVDYRDSHRRHHQVRLTVPGVDPESFYVDAETWRGAGPITRAVLLVNRTLLGRLVLWPGVVIARTLVDAVRTAPFDRSARRRWAMHLPAVATTLWLVCAVGGVPWWLFLGGFVYGGLSVTYIRSFVEHLGVAHGTECAVVRANAFWGLLFLNNNLHHTHHNAEGAAWYRLPALAKEFDSDGAAAAGAGLYRGYGEVFRRYLVRPFDAPVHPAERTHDGSAVAAA